MGSIILTLLSARLCEFETVQLCEDLPDLSSNSVHFVQSYMQLQRFNFLEHNLARPLLTLHDLSTDLHNLVIFCL
jgi:hypothetical protein